MQQLRMPILAVLLAGVAFSSFFIYRIESDKRVLETELIELSKVKYGLFNVDVWTEELTRIIIVRVNEFQMSESREDELRIKIEEFLEIAIAELEEGFEEENKGSVGGFLKRGVASVTDVFGLMREKTPEITESIIIFIKDPENKELAKDFLIDKMQEYSDSTFSEIDYSLYDRILAKHDATEKREAINIIKGKVDSLNDRRTPYSVALFGIIGLLALIIPFSSDFMKAEFTVLTIICGILLSVGVLIPMINIDARISRMEFELMGESIIFIDQVLYFKSKSILEVVWVMITNKKVDVMAVGILVFSFSVLFPVSKLLGSIAYIYSEKLKNNPVIKFLVFKTAKWSMADVMVVAIFMAYIGFTGIISEQLTSLENIALNVDIMTTNASSLQIGFFLFTAFAVLSLMVSHKLQYGGEN
ncbi:paraquat-inducible protein A [Balneola sp. EhC07]|uniref:paraquat-inducible protein A n=1 Tax=Balneola sp. EhC07 TaxID=1849360 RepID=UPI0013722F1B|nr:paraquat-inducible protein A [Balneola sp. EhC07]